ncbi:MAG: hypothetical protein ABI607_00595 [Betaproteobacteria bacterium]
MDITASLGLTLIALLLAFWSLTWARRTAVAAERTAVAAEKSALAAERSAMAARRSAEAAEANAIKAVATAPGHPAQPANRELQATAAWVDLFVQELVDSWTKEASAWPLVERNPGLADDEVEAIIRKAFHSMGRTEAESKHHAVAVLNMRHDRKV